jgi:hypothetical protein
MAQLDSSIYFQGQGALARGFEQGLSMADMMQKRKAAQAATERESGMEKAYAAGLVTGPDGVATYDGTKTMSALAGGGFGKEAAAFDKNLKADQAVQSKAKMEKQLQQIDITSRLLGSVKDQQSYDFAKTEAAKYGIPVEGMPMTYDPKQIEFMAGQALTMKDRISNQFQQQAAERDERRVSIAERESRNKSASGEKLPIDKKKFVEALSSKNASKASIKSQIDAVMSNWDNLSEDQKVSQGGQLLKTLNSAEGADAIGVEEAKRLGSKLEFAYGNFRNSNPTQFGRDLDGFKEQARLTSEAIGKSVQTNQAQVDEAMGRKSAAKPQTQAPHNEAVMWAHNNPKDPRSAEILKRNGIKPGTAQGGL